MSGRSSPVPPVGVAAALRGAEAEGGFPVGPRGSGSTVYEEGCTEEDVDAGYQVDGEESEDGEEDAAGGKGPVPQGGHTQDESPGIGKGWTLFVVLFVFQLTVPSILWSYGVLMTRMIESGDIELPIVLWTPALFSATYCLADPWLRWPAMRGGSAGRRARVWAPWLLRPLAVAGILLTAASLALTPFFPSRDYCLLTYGVLAGLGSCMAVTQSELALDQRFPPRKRRHSKRVFSLATIRIACSISQITSPLVLMAFVNTFGRRYAPMLQSGIVLQALVAASLLRYKRTDGVGRAVRLTSMSYSIMEEEDGAFTESGWNFGGLATATPEGEKLLPFEENFGGRSWKNPARDDATCLDAKDDGDDISSDEPIEPQNPDGITSLLQLPRKKNSYGVEILPQIPEETEEEESGEDCHCKRSSRRLTLTIPSANNNNNNSNGKGLQVPPSGSPTPQNNALCFANGNNSYQPDTPTSTSSTTLLISPSGGVGKWKRWRWKRRKWRRRRRSRDRTASCGSSSCRDEDEEEEEVGGLSGDGEGCKWRQGLGGVVSLRGLAKASFYPGLALSVSTRLAGVVFFTLVPLLARRMGRSNNDATLLVSIAGFSSLLVSAASPWISYPTPRKKDGNLFEPRCCKKFVYSVGSLVSAVAFFLLSRAEWYDKLTMAAILFGVGSGATADTSASLLRVASVGSTNVDGSRGLMCTLTAFLILGCTALLDAYTGASPGGYVAGSQLPSLPAVASLSICFSILAIIQFLAGITWLIQPVLSRFYRRQRHFTSWTPGMIIQTA
ncbi:uncharacterized protein [Hetaerina americana]|uniref:uncharacterized protein n=1 Tax=Hetaerina americana TaxID=62018 RepID=UPI003A7F2611